MSQKINFTFKKMVILINIFLLIFLAVSIFLINKTLNFTNNGIPTDALVIDHEEKYSDGDYLYYPIVEFTATNGQIIKGTSNFGSSNFIFQPGDTMEILYLPDNPQDFTADSIIAMWIAPGIFLIFVLIGGIGINYGYWLNKNNLKKKQALLTSGKRVKAKFLKFNKNNNVKVMGNSPYVIFADWTDPATKIPYTFKSENLWTDPTQYLHGKDDIDIYIDHTNPKLYIMDTRFIPDNKN